MNTINKYVWLVETIYKARRITFEDLNDKWLADEDMSGGVELSLRTFHKWRIAAEEIFGLCIECERKGGYHYYIENTQELSGGSFRSWLFNNIAVSNLLLSNRQLKDRILLETIPAGRAHLPVILESMKKGITLYITYRSFWRDESNSFDVEPYCVKLFKQRWYMVARSPYYDKVMIYALDRIEELSPLPDKPFAMPDDFSPEAYFEDSYGIIVGDDTPVQTVRLKVQSEQARYLRSLPLHSSQREIQSDEDFTIFKLRLRPTFDFVQELLLHTPDIEVLEPQSLREEVARKLTEGAELYK